MTHKPNVLRRALHRFLMLAPVSAFLARVLHHLDAAVWKLNGGRFSITSLVAGLPTFKVTTIGAKSKMPRALPLIGFMDGEKIALIASNFGRQFNPAWYHNLKANPECSVQWDGRDENFIARETQGEEREHYWRMAVSFYAGYDAYRVRAGERSIPVMVLEPKK
ncbi:MAG: nitroreductase family deazaflavin-dependent oxidoreductase [Chloroflexi bacterium]|nr:nitroreductase family deazaflavin-dependent oxidoreductase [Chloroflexota bacterium]